jgi:ribosome-binding ATPase YchF (GTP1/OBG family)
MELILADIESLTKRITTEAKNARKDKDLAAKLLTLEKALELLES